jgi:hypothetical protein
MPVQRKKYLVPAILSAFVAGLGQLTKGEPKKGLKIMMWFYMGLPVILYGTLLLNSYVFLIIFAAFVIIYPLFWVLNIMDAYNTQHRIKRSL